ncbi:MAG: type II toxin-antitoxin system RelE/ParE family toxin [Verrucomicrobia bacterium]|nr:type II toxin-antitoxin system RelE/ParE family toxin [Verrucomicrobiota bacterium]
MNLEFLPEARAEFCEAADYYEGKERGLGKRFSAEIREVCATVLTHPLLWREREGGFRRVNCPVFPYYVAYFIRGNAILIAAVAHGSRHPDYWKGRLP